MQNKNWKKSRSAGFSLTELVLALAVVLIIISGLLYSANRVMSAGRQTTAAQTVSNLAQAEQTFAHNWQGYSPLGTNLGGSENSATTASTFALDEELATAEANALDKGFANSGYTILYKAGGTAYQDSSGNAVNPLFEFTAIPINVSDPKAYCSDQTGTWFATTGTGATPASGAGCKADGYSLK